MGVLLREFSLWVLWILLAVLLVFWPIGLPGRSCVLFALFKLVHLVGETLCCPGIYSVGSEKTCNFLRT